jgi:hypothetical protein
MSPGISPTVTHNSIIADRSRAGMVAIASILEICPMADERISAWHNSVDGYFVFILENKSGRVGSITASDLDHLFTEILPELFADHLMPPSNAVFDIFVDEADAKKIQNRVDQLLIAAALEAGKRL